MIAMARLTVQSAQQHRVWEVSSLDTFLISSTAPTILAAKEAGRLYRLEIQSASAARRAEMGPPHVHVHRALIISLVSLLKAMTPQPEALAILQQREQWLAQVTLKAAEEAITVTRVSRTRQTEISRVQVRVQDENLRKAVKVSLCATGARHMAGTAPPSHHERVTARTWKFDPGSATNCFQVHHATSFAVLPLDRDTESI